MPAQFTKHFVQDLTQDIKIRQCGTIAFNADNESNVITVDLYNGTEPYSGGGTVAGAVICPDGATVALDNGTLTGNVASVTLKADCFAIPGQIGVGVQVISGSVRTTVLKAIYNVELLSTDNMVDPDSRITASVTQLVADIEAATAEIPASDMASLMSGIAPTFSATTNYAAGAYVYYSGTLYRFTNAHAAGSWTGTDVTEAALANDVDDLKSAFMSEDYTTLADMYGKAIKSDGTLNDSRAAYTCSDFIRIPELTKSIKMGNHFKAGNSSIYLDPAIVFYDESKDPILPCPAKVTTQYATFTVPDDAVYIRFNQGNPQSTNNNTFTSGLWFISSIGDSIDSLNTAVEKIGKTYSYTPVNTWEESAVPSAITQKLNAMENDILCVFQGDSLTGLTEYSEAQEDPEHCPPGMQYKSWTYYLWQNMARVKPMCDRLDSQRNSADFFTKTGTWEQVDGTKFNDDNYAWSFTHERSVACLTYQSASDDAAVSFTFDADTYNKCNIVYSLKPDGADCEIVITQGNGKMLVSLDRSTWVEANGFTHTQQSNPDGSAYAEVRDDGLAIQQRHRRLWMKKASDVTGNITITYKRASSSASDSYMYCWGAERWSGNTVFVDNIGRGGRYTRTLSYNISDIFDRNPDFAVYEMPLANETDEGFSNIYGFYQQYFLSDGNNSYKTRSNNYTDVPLIVFLPHGRGVFFNDDNAAIFATDYQVAGDPPAYVIYMAIWDWLKNQLSSYSNVSVINLYCRLLNEATGIGQPINVVFGSNGEYAFTRDTTHLNEKGAKMYCKYLLPLFQR